MIDTLVNVLSWGCLLGGGAFSIIGGLGMLRLPDFYTRLHAAGMTDTLGAGLILLGLVLQAGWTLVTAKLVFIFIFIVWTSPTAAHALALAAEHGKVRPLLIGDGGSGESAGEGTK